MKTLGDVMRKARERAYSDALMLRAEIATPRPGWECHAACTPADEAAFWPRKGASGDAARAICATCPVRLDCLADAWQHEHGSDLFTHGTRGGLPASARLAPSRRWRNDPDADVIALLPYVRAYTDQETH